MKATSSTLISLTRLQSLYGTLMPPSPPSPVKGTQRIYVLMLELSWEGVEGKLLLTAQLQIKMHAEV